MLRASGLQKMDKDHMGFAHAQDDMDHVTASTGGCCSLLALASLNPVTCPVIAIASSTDAGSELLLRSPSRASRQVLAIFWVSRRQWRDCGYQKSDVQTVHI